MVFERLRTAFARLAGLPLVDEKEVRSFIKELQRVLISSDVNIRLVFDISKRIERRALHTEKLDALTVKEHVLKVIYEELVNLMGKKYEPTLQPQRILLVGLYGSGKTTTCAKLGKFFKDKGLSVALVACDVSRPAAQEQLLTLANQIGAKCYVDGKDAVEILSNALKQSKEDVLIVDSGGRSAFDEELQDELKNLVDLLKPDQTFLVVSADIGQGAGKQAKAFADTIPLTGVIVTKMEGSGKGGGALSSVAATNTKIAFIGTGEKVGDLEPFDPEKFVKKLLGLPDLDSLINKLKSMEIEVEDENELNLNTFLQQMRAMKSMGPVSQMFQHFGMYDVPPEMIEKSEEQMKRMEAMVNSMTKEERRHPEIILKERSRADRIARGSGTRTSDVISFIKMFEKMKKMAKQLKRQRGMGKHLQKLMKKFGKIL